MVYSFTGLATARLHLLVRLNRKGKRLVKREAFSFEDSNRLTLSGAIIGTPHYMSPEQARGTRVDVRSDVYSFGCVVYEMLTGQLPFSGNTHRSLCLGRGTVSRQPWAWFRSQVPPGGIMNP